MTKNPIVNALTAAAYIIVLVMVMNFGTKLVPHPNSLITPIAVISLFTLSAAVMGFIFCYQPGQLYFDGKKKTAVKLFLQTILVFGCITAILLTLLFSGALR